MNRGVCIVAVGHPYYGRMAFNLAKTIKAVDRDCQIQIICDGTALDHISRRETWVFDIVTHVSAQNGFRLKLNIDKISSFDQFVLMDADCAWVSNKSPIELMKIMAIGNDFAGITEGFHDYDDPAKNDVCKNYPFWADVEELRKMYDLGGRIYQWRTEFMFVNKCDHVHDFFEDARWVYDRASELSTLKMFAHSVPDELGINAAACIHGINPIPYKWRPTFWHRMHGYMPSIEELQHKYYAISCGSNVTSSLVKKLYDRVVKAASSKLGTQHVFPMINKREMMPHRQQM